MGIVRNWLWKKQWWHRKDRSKFAVFMDFYCERMYPALVAVILMFIFYTMVFG